VATADMSLGSHGDGDRSRPCPAAPRPAVRHEGADTEHARDEPNETADDWNSHGKLECHEP